MKLAQYILHPVIQDFVKDFEAGDWLFRQGETGTTMYLIVDGIVQLFDENEEGMHLVGTYGPGQFFGEKTMVVPTLQRFFSAQAQMKTTIMEFKRADIPTIQKVIPDFMMLMFQAAVNRLERAYYLNRVLRSSDDLERLIHCIIYFYRCPGVEGVAARYLPLTVEDVVYLISMEEKRVRKCLDELARRNILVKRPNDCYLLRDEKGLMTVMPELERLLTEAA